MPFTEVPSPPRLRNTHGCTVDDLAAHTSDWVEPLRQAYRGVEVCELPSNGQGAAVLVGLGILEDPGSRSSWRDRSGQDRARLGRKYHLRGPSPAPPLEGLRRRIALDAVLETEVWPSTDTTYLCAVDADRNAISLIQSTFEQFGSGVLAGDTGVVLQNRAACFRSDPTHPNCLAPGKRPFHTIIPGLRLADDCLLRTVRDYGRPNAGRDHIQVVRRLVDEGLDPQGALDAPRFRVAGGRRVLRSPGLSLPFSASERSAMRQLSTPTPHSFGVGQMILTFGEGLIGGSDGRGDGYAAGI